MLLDTTTVIILSEKAGHVKLFPQIIKGRTPMEVTLNREGRRRIGKLISRIDRLSARAELIQVAYNRHCTLTVEGEADGGKVFAVHITPYGIRYGEREADGYCAFDAYGPDGEHTFSWGGDVLDLLEEVSRSPQ